MLTTKSIRRKGTGKCTNDRRSANAATVSLQLVKVNRTGKRIKVITKSRKINSHSLDPHPCKAAARQLKGRLANPSPAWERGREKRKSNTKLNKSLEQGLNLSRS